ncbi:MAG TPA: hypothetical protein IAB65_01830 [Candidatus Onthocola stercorigallinarum]|jgi:uncharacterized membrane protein|nr:hypothetical protein [Candidatus Onthocola stercorigallinarum]
MKKSFLMLLLVIGTFVIFTPSALAAEAWDVCERSEVLTVLRVVGYIIYVAKIVIPLLLIIFGSIDFAKAIIANDEKAIKTAGGALVRRFIAAVVVFLIPTILNLLLGLVDNIESIKGTFSDCTNCIFNPMDDSACRGTQGGGRN